MVKKWKQPVSREADTRTCVSATWKEMVEPHVSPAFLWTSARSRTFGSTPAESRCLGQLGSRVPSRGSGAKRSGAALLDGRLLAREGPTIRSQQAFRQEPSYQYSQVIG